MVLPPRRNKVPAARENLYFGWTCSRISLVHFIPAMNQGIAPRHRIPVTITNARVITRAAEKTGVTEYRPCKRMRHPLDKCQYEAHGHHVGLYKKHMNLLGDARCAVQHHSVFCTLLLCPLLCAASLRSIALIFSVSPYMELSLLPISEPLCFCSVF